MHPFGGQMSWDGHVALVHDDEPRRREGVAAWGRHSLEAGAKVLYIEPPFEPVDRSFLGLLVEHEVDIADAVRSGQLEVFTADEQAYDPAWQAGTTEKALADGYPTVSWSGEAVTAWGVMPPREHTEVEWATDSLCSSQPVSVLCQYSAGLPRAGLQAVCAMHGAGVREAQLEIVPAPDGVALAGTVDASNERVLRSALLAVTPRQREAWLDVELSRLEFLDVAGARAFLAGTSTHRLNGGNVRLRGAHGTVERVLSLLAVDRSDRFAVVPG